jgi:predicted glycosyltransferase
MPDILAQCDLVISDSQTMTAEAAVLGTPALRINDFVGKLGYLKELEERYGLCHGFKPDQTEAFLTKIDALAGDSNAKKHNLKRRQSLLNNSIDPTNFFVNLLTDHKTAVSANKKNNHPLQFTPGHHA